MQAGTHTRACPEQEISCTLAHIVIISKTCSYGRDRPHSNRPIRRLRDLVNLLHMTTCMGDQTPPMPTRLSCQTQEPATGRLSPLREPPPNTCLFPNQSLCNSPSVYPGAFAHTTVPTSDLCPRMGATPCNPTPNPG